MIRKILFAIILLFSAVAALSIFLLCNQDILIDKFENYVKETTGSPIVLEKSPKLTFFPNRGLELGSGSWNKSDGTLSLSFKSADVRISSHSLFAGVFSIKYFAVDGLSVTARIDRPFLDLCTKNVLHTLKDFTSSELSRLLPRILDAAPDAIRITNGTFRLISSDGAILAFSPINLSSNDIHPDKHASIVLSTPLKGTDPDFSGILDLQCSVFFNDKQASLNFTKAQFSPKSGLKFTTPISISGGVDYTYECGGAAFRKLKLSGPGAALAVSGTLQVPGQTHFCTRHALNSLKLESQFNLPELFPILGVKYPFAPGGMDNCKASAEASWNGSKYTLSGAKIVTPSIEAGLNLVFDPPHSLLTGEIELGDLDLSRKLWLENGIIAAGLAEKDFSLWPKSDIAVKIRSLRKNGFEISNFNSRLTGQGGIYEFNPISAVALGSPVTASLKTVLTPGTPFSALCSTNISIPQAGLGILGKTLFGNSFCEGTGSINTSLQFSTDKGISSLNGMFGISSDSMRPRFSVLPSGLPPSVPQSIPEQFDSLVLSGGIRSGTALIERFKMDSARLSISGTGSINLSDRKMDASGKLVTARGAVFPVRLEGHAESPSYRIDWPTENIIGTFKSKTPLSQKIEILTGRIAAEK